MKKKKIIANNFEFEFFFDENLEMWRIIETPNIILNNNIDIEIDLSKIGKNIDWEVVIKFIEFIKTNNILFNERIEDAQTLLKSFFTIVNKNIYSETFLEDIEFRISGIDFLGFSNQINLKNNFVFDLFFFPIYRKDEYQDIGVFTWRANFRDLLLLGVFCDRI